MSVHEIKKLKRELKNLECRMKPLFTVQRFNDMPIPCLSLRPPESPTNSLEVLLIT